MYRTCWITRVLIAGVFILGSISSMAQADEYSSAVAKWTSYKDVGNWLSNNFEFDMSRKHRVDLRVREQGPKGLLARDPAKLFEEKTGYCIDAAHFALDALNRIDPNYQAQWVLIKNTLGSPHWVTSFESEGKLYVIDYGAGPGWSEMEGIHGPYDSLSEYEAFLASLRISNFSVESVNWRNMPGTVD